MASFTSAFNNFYSAYCHFITYTMLLNSCGDGNGNPLQYSCLENPMDGGAWWAAVHGIAKSQTWLSDFTFTFHFHALEKEMATDSSVLAWRIPGMEEPGGPLSMGSHRVGHDWSDLAAAAAKRIMLSICQPDSGMLWAARNKRPANSGLRQYLPISVPSTIVHSKCVPDALKYWHN